jgi:hypothetical protein
MCGVKLGLAVVVLVCSGCIERGPLAVDPDRHFAGLRDILDDLPPNGTLNVVLVHGMRADAPQTFTRLEQQLQSRLHLGEMQSQQTWGLVAITPLVTLENESLFGTDNWGLFRPRLTMDRFQTVAGSKVIHVNFYRFEYWQALAYIKCRYVIAPDTKIVGATTRSTYCAAKPWEAVPTQRLSSEPEFGNRWLKSEIIEWGLSDAIIATSQYRTVLRQAVREALEIATRDGIAAAPAAPSSVGERKTDELAGVPDNYRHRFAFVTESLGSYVISDALSTLVTPTSADSVANAQRQPDAERMTAQIRAVRFAVCGATQVHMLANQLALLRLSELDVASNIASSGAKDRTNPESEAASARTVQAHFFAGCRGAGNTHPRNGVAFGARQIVAYHEPNDLLSYYTSDKPGAIGTANVETTNVVFPYTTLWVPFLLADPSTAHTGQPDVPAIMNLLGCGHAVGTPPACRSE